MRASETAYGNGESHRSGFHSRASSPHSVLLQLQPRIPTRSLDPFGTKMDVVCLPSVVRIGSERGKTVSWWQLQRNEVI